MTVKCKMVKAKDLKYEFGARLTARVIEQAIKESGAVFELTKHKKLWNFLKENPGKEKADWFDETGNKYVLNDCYACSFANKVLRYIEERYGRKFVEYLTVDTFFNGCIACPFEVDCEECLDGIYEDWWLITENYEGGKDEDELIASLSRQIANFRLREDVKIPVI